MGATLFDKIWSQHRVFEDEGGKTLLYIDRVVVDDVRAPQVLKNLNRRALAIRRADLAVVVQDHSVPSFQTHTSLGGSVFVDATREAARNYGLRLLDVGDAEQGISHVTLPALGLVLPGSIYLCVDSHSPTVGGVGAIGLACGSTELEHVLATQTMWLRKPRQMRLTFEGTLGSGVYAKDLILHLIGRLGIEIARGVALELTGSLIASLSIEARLTLCNMAVELGARTCIVAPDEVTFAWLATLPHVPRGEMWRSAYAHWQELRSDCDANFDIDLKIDCADLEPQITWGTSPAQVTSIAGSVPATAALAGLDEAIWQRALGYMDLRPGARLAGTKVDRVFIGSCTNARLEDIKRAALIAVGRKVASHVKAVVVPGSCAVSRKAQGQGLRDILVDAGFFWGEPGCSMCAGGGGEKVVAGERIVSTTNRNFENRQGAGVRTHLASPATAAAAAIMGEICDPRPLMRGMEDV